MESAYLLLHDFHDVDAKRLSIIYIWGHGACARVILVLLECIWNVPADSLVLPAFDDAGSLGSPPLQVVYPLSSTLGDRLPFPCGE